MKSSPRSSTEQKLLEYVQMRSVGPPEGASIVELTATVQYAIEAQLPNTLTTLLRELGRRGGLVVSVQPSGQPLRSSMPAPQVRMRA